MTIEKRQHGCPVSVTNLHKVYVHEGKKLLVLDGIDVEFAPGDMVSISGRSGAGKSTFLHVLGTLDRPSKGQVLFDGRDVFGLGSTQLARFRNANIGFVFQSHHLLPEFNALENVMMPALIRRLPRNEAMSKAKKLLDMVGLSQRLSHKPGELSGGEQQRVALARALVMSPSLLLADEPTGNLDQTTSQGIHELFLELNQNLKLTIIVVTHNPKLAALMPRPMVMKEGKLFDDDSLTAAPSVPQDAAADIVPSQDAMASDSFDDENASSDSEAS